MFDKSLPMSEFKPGSSGDHNHVGTANGVCLFVVAQNFGCPNVA